MAAAAAPAATKPDPRPDGGGWTVVAPRRRRSGAQHRKKDPDNDPEADDLHQTRTLETLPWTPSDSDSDPARVARLIQKVRSSMAKLESSGFCRRFLSQFREDPRIRQNLYRVSSCPLSSSSSGQPEPIRVVVYGVGSIESYEPPRLQLSLALLLGRELGGAEATAADVEVFDPVLSAIECGAAEALGCRVLLVNERGRRAAERPTLFYMPHCEAVLYDNLLAANWGRPTALGQMVVLGNSFTEYGKCVEEGFGAMAAVTEKARHVLAARGFVEEIGIEKAALDGEEGNDDALVRAFNETSWHFFQLDVADTGADQFRLMKI